MLMMSAPMFTAWTIPDARVERVEVPFSLSSSFAGPYAPEVCLMEMMVASGAMPTKLSLGEGWDAMIPAMSVPWWSQSESPSSPMT